MNKEKLKEILEKHKKWLSNEEDGERADLRYADLSSADLRYADLRYADLRFADLRYADLRYADLNSANLHSADLRYADLRYADLSSAENLMSSIDFLKSHFESCQDGYIVYKTFNSTRAVPNEWSIKPGSVITENVNFLKSQECGCGINVAPLKWVEKNYPRKDVWKCLIRWEWLAGVCCPYNSDGKIRCEKVELLEVVK